jgi:hypothetical protein
MLEKSVASLQEDNVELTQTIMAMKNNQYQDQVKMVPLQTELESTNRKLEIASNDIKKCKTSLGTVEERMATLSTKEDTNNRFDRIESIISGALGAPHITRTAGTLTLTGKRKEQASEPEQGEEEDFADSQQIMETEYHEETYASENNGTEGGNDQTNSSMEGMTRHMQVK